MTVTGECMCGAVKVTIPDLTPDKTSAYCHCLNCKKQSGASGTIVMLFPKADVKIEGKTRVYDDKKTDTGKNLERFFCEECGCPIYTHAEMWTGMTIVKMGLFGHCPKPAVEMYTKNRQSWEPSAIAEGCAQLQGAS